MQGFWGGFSKPKPRKMLELNFFEIPKNRAPVEAKRIFSRFRDLEFERWFRKCVQKSCVFWNIDLEGFWGGFWEGFGTPKSLIFTIFSMFFGSHFRSAFGRGQKSTREASKCGSCAFLPPVSGHPPPPGERKREGIKSLAYHQELGLSD